jgi:hypothetical protein
VLDWVKIIRRSSVPDHGHPLAGRSADLDLPARRTGCGLRAVNIARGQAEELLKHRIYEVDTTPE